MQQWKFALTSCTKLALRRSTHSLEVMKYVVNEEGFFFKRFITHVDWILVSKVPLPRIKPQLIEHRARLLLPNFTPEKVKKKKE